MTASFDLLTTPTEDEAWFSALADLLLNRCDLLVHGAPHRLLELEVYYHSDAHPDPFVHGDDLQKTTGRWYFHRDSGEYRGGSFKGLDLSFGPEGVVGGVLIRTLAAPDGAVINGCSLCVDHLLAQTGHAHVRDLDAALGERRVWEEGGPLQLVHAEAPREDAVLATARVGLTLKRASQLKRMPEYLMRPYRFLTDPTIAKGKVHTVIALHKRGDAPEVIKHQTGTPLKSIQRYLDAFHQGEALESFTTHYGKALSTEDLCAIHGLWHQRYDAEAP